MPKGTEVSKISHILILTEAGLASAGFMVKKKIYICTRKNAQKSL